MATRVSLRRVGGTTAKKAALPATMAELLELATTKLALESPATRVFAAGRPGPRDLHSWL